MTARVVFLGSPEFAVPSLRALAADDRFDVALVVTQPDRPAGRGRRLQPPPVAEVARELGLSLFQPRSLRSAETFDALAAARADVFIVVAYGEILRRRVLEMPPGGVLNVHPSLLPRYRGSSPIPAAILNGDTETGVSVIKLVRALDAGPIVAQRSVGLTGLETSGSLSEELARVAAEMLPDTMEKWLAGRLATVPQDEAGASYTRELTKEDGRIDWRAGAVGIERLVRAMNPWPTAWTMLAGRRLSILVCHISLQPTKHTTTTITVEPPLPAVACGDGFVYLDRVRPEGRAEMSGADWLRGARLPPDARFEDG